MKLPRPPRRAAVTLTTAKGSNTKYSDLLKEARVVKLNERLAYRIFDVEEQSRENSFSRYLAKKAEALACRLKIGLFKSRKYKDQQTDQDGGNSNIRSGRFDNTA